MNSKIYLAGGCFWCTEAIFNRVEGVKKVIPGYIGNVKNPHIKRFVQVELVMLRLFFRIW